MIFLESLSIYLRFSLKRFYDVYWGSCWHEYTISFLHGLLSLSCECMTCGHDFLSNMIGPMG